VKPPPPHRHPAGPVRPTGPGRDGIALLMVLAAVVVVLAALTAGLGAVRRTSAEAGLARDAWRGEALRADAERLLHAWCAAEGATIWTPSDQPHRPWLVLDDAWHGQDGTARVTLLVWDALSGVPVAVPDARVALRRSLPPRWQELQLDPALEPPIPFLDRVPVAAGLRRYPPVPVLPAPRAWSPQGGLSPAAPPPAVPAETVPTAALALSPHSDGRLNLRTAPPERIAAALRDHGRGGLLEDLLAQRDAGEEPTPPLDLTAEQDTGLRLVATTDRWAALLRIRSGATERRWWLICAGTDEGVTTLQRHAVGE